MKNNSLYKSIFNIVLISSLINFSSLSLGLKAYADDETPYEETTNYEGVNYDQDDAELAIEDTEGSVKDDYLDYEDDNSLNSSGKLTLEKGELPRNVMMTISSLLTITLNIITNSTCKNVASVVMTWGTSIALLGSLVSSWVAFAKLHSKNNEFLRKQMTVWDESEVEYDIQLKGLELAAESSDRMETASKTTKIIHYIGAGVFLAAAVMAAIEAIWPYKAFSVCVSQNNLKDTIDPVKKEMIANLLKKALFEEDLNELVFGSKLNRIFLTNSLMTAQYNVESNLNQLLGQINLSKLIGIDSAHAVGDCTDDDAESDCNTGASAWNTTLSSGSSVLKIAGMLIPLVIKSAGDAFAQEALSNAGKEVSEKVSKKLAARAARKAGQEAAGDATKEAASATVASRFSSIMRAIFYSLDAVQFIQTGNVYRNNQKIYENRASTYRKLANTLTARMNGLTISAAGEEVGVSQIGLSRPGGEETQEAIGCVGSGSGNDGVIDPNCDCKSDDSCKSQAINEQALMKMNVPDSVIGSYKSAETGLNHMTNGNGRRVNSGELVQGAAKLKEDFDKALDGALEKLEKDGLRVDKDGLMERAKAAILKRNSDLYNGLSSDMKDGLAGLANQAISIPEEKTKEEEVEEIKEIKEIAPKKNKGPSFNFAEDKKDEVLDLFGKNDKKSKKKYSGKDKDINETKYNLFEVISRAYKKSGYKRLFDKKPQKTLK